MQDFVFHLYTEQERQYESELFPKMCHLLHIKRTRTAPYSYKVDGIVEKFNTNLLTMISACVNEHKSDWDMFPTS